MTEGSLTVSAATATASIVLKWQRGSVVKWCLFSPEPVPTKKSNNNNMLSGRRSHFWFVRRYAQHSGLHCRAQTGVDGHHKHEDDSSVSGDFIGFRCQRVWSAVGEVRILQCSQLIRVHGVVALRSCGCQVCHSRLRNCKGNVHSEFLATDRHWVLLGKNQYHLRRTFPPRWFALQS